MLEYQCHLIDLKISGNVSVNDKKTNREDFDNYIEIQTNINKSEASALYIEEKLNKLINDAITTAILQNPNNEQNIKDTYEPRLIHLRNKLAEKVSES